MNSHAQSSGISPVLLSARVVWLEITRREQYFALLILMGLYLFFAVGARLAGNTQAEAVALLLNMGLWLASALAAVLTLISSARALTMEMEMQTLYPLLAKPVARGEILLGKWLASMLAGWLCFGVFGILTVLTWTAQFPLPGQSMQMFAQSIPLQLAALGLLASSGLLLSLLLPPSVSILIGGFLYFGGGLVSNLLMTLMRDSRLSLWIDALLQYLPQFSKLCLLQRFTDGAPPLSWGEWSLLLIYSIGVTFAFLGLANRLFDRRSL